MSYRNYPTTVYRYAMAITLVAIGLLARAIFIPIMGPTTPFVLLAIAISAWHGGLGPGLTATFLSGFLIYIFPAHMLGSVSHHYPSALPLTITVMVMGTLITILFEYLHRAQKQTMHMLREVAESDKRFRLMVDSVKDYGIFMLDETGHIISWNTGARNINGYEANEIIGRHFSTFYPPEDVAAGKPEYELEVASEVGRFEDEGWRLRKDGSRFWSNVIISAVRDDGGELRGFTKVTRDMTERRQAEENARLLALEQAKRNEAEAANKAKDQFLSVLSHELRTPLNAIIGWLSLLRSGRLDEQTTAVAFESIERSSRTQTRLVEDLLDVSRMLAGKLLIQRAPIELNELLASVVDTLRPAIEEKKIEFEIFSYPTSVFVYGDAIRLEQVISNLLQNALKFTPSSGRITISLSKVGSQAEIVVKDNGPGISPVALPYIFENFRQADSSQTRQYGGLGLGLAIVRYVVEAHDGTIKAESPGEGQGATFTVQIPLTERKEAEANAGTSMAGSSNSERTS